MSWPKARVWQPAGSRRGARLLRGVLGQAGRYLVDEADDFRPLLVGPTSLLALDEDGWRALLQDYQRRGFNGVRVFAGGLSWAGQTPTQALSRLPRLLSDLADLRMVAFVSALTDSAYMPNPESHLAQVVAVCRSQKNVLLEAANEPYHETQAALCHTYSQLAAAMLRAQPVVPWCLGAPQEAQLDADARAGSQGTFCSYHLDRSRGGFEETRRLKEFGDYAAQTGKFTMSGEPKGAADDASSSRENDPVFFYTIGLLCRAHDLGCCFHSDNGLHAQPFSPQQGACADACVAGFCLLPTEERLRFYNAGWGGSPITGAAFQSGNIVRAYAYVGRQSFAALLGVKGDHGVQLAPGWKLGAALTDQPARDWSRLQVYELVRR